MILVCKLLEKIIGNPMLLMRKIFILINACLLASCLQNQTQPEVRPQVESQQQHTQYTEQVTPLTKAKAVKLKPEVQVEYFAERPDISKQTKAYINAQIKSLESSGSLPIIQSRQQITPGIAKLEVTSNEMSEKDIVQLDYEQVELRQILEEIADTLGMSIVIDPSINTKITMRTAPESPLKYKDLWPLLNMLLNESGISLEKKAGVFYAKKSALFIPETMGYASMLTKHNGGKIMQITPLRNISIPSALAVLTPLVGSYTHIAQIEQLNTLSIIGSPEQLKKINGLLSLIDVDPFRSRGIRIYKIKEAGAKKVAADLNDILKLIEGAQPAYQVLSLDRINSLLVVAPPGRGFKSVDKWVEILDEGESLALQEQIFLYHCKSVNCDSLSSTLNAILDNTIEAGEKKINQQDEPSPNIFRTVPKDSLSVKAAGKGRLGKQPETVQKSTQKKPAIVGGASANIIATIVSDIDSNSLLIRTTAKDYRQLLETIILLDKVPLQVLVNVVIAQVTLSENQSLGIDWSYASSNGIIQTNFGVAQQVSREGTPLGVIINRIGGDWRATLNAVAKDSNVNILSRPSLLISNNQVGAISVGKEVPVQTSETTNLDSGTGTSVNQVTQQIAYRKTGIEMTIIPHINDDGIINMEIKQSLSSIEGATNSSDAGFKPTFGNQEITTTIIAEDNQTIILGGLIETITVKSETGIPIAKDVPIIGALFKTQTEQTERRELVLIITPKIISRETDMESFNAEFNKRFNSVSHYLVKQLNNSY